MGKLRLRQVRSFAKLMQLSSMKQNWHSTFSLFDTCILFSTPKLLGPFGKWKEQRLKDEETSVFKAPETSLQFISSSREPQGLGLAFHLPIFPTRKQKPKGMNAWPRVLLARTWRQNLGPVCPKLLAFPVPPPSSRRPLALGHRRAHPTSPLSALL